MVPNISFFSHFRSKCHESFPFLCPPAKSPPEPPFPPRSAARAAPVLALWLTSKPKLSSPEPSERRRPRCRLRRRQLCRARGQEGAVVSRHILHPGLAQHPHRHQPGYSPPPPPPAIRAVLLLLDHWTPSVRSAQTRLTHLIQTNLKIVQHNLYLCSRRDRSTQLLVDPLPGPAPASRPTTHWSLSSCRAKRFRWSRSSRSRCPRWKWRCPPSPLGVRGGRPTLRSTGLICTCPTSSTQQHERGFSQNTRDTTGNFLTRRLRNRSSRL